MPWTQVDADFQIQNLPPPGGGFIYMGSNPDTAPFTSTPLRFDQGAGFAITSGLAQLRLASLSQQGVIGTAGYQQLQGPTFFVGNPAAGAVPPLTGHSWGAILQDGGLGFYTSSEGALTALNAGITYGPFGLLNFTNKHSMLWGAGTVATPAAMQFKNLYALSEIDLDSSGNVTHTFNNIFRAVSLPPPATLSWGPFSPPGTYLLDLESFDTPGPSYSLQAGTLVGQWGTSGGGDIVSGGIITTLGGGGGIAIGNPISGGTPSELLWVDGGGNLAGTANIATDGTTINLTDIGSGHTLLITPDIAGSGGWLSANFGLNLDGDGSRIQLIANTTITFAPSNGTPNMQLTNARLLTGLPIYFNSTADIGSGAADTGLERNASGDLSFTNAAGTTYATVGASGAQLCQLGGSSLGFFAIGPVTQRSATGLPGGWNPGTSGNFLQTDDIFNGGLGTTFYSIGDIILALKQYGLLLQ